MDIHTLSSTLGDTIHDLRKQSGKTMVQISVDSGISRDVIYRMEQGKDVYVSSLLDTLRAMGYGIRIERMRMPTIEEMHAFLKRDPDFDFLD